MLVLIINDSPKAVSQDVVKLFKLADDLTNLKLDWKSFNIKEKTEYSCFIYDDKSNEVNQYLAIRWVEEV